MSKRLLILGGGGVTLEYYLPALHKLGLLDQTVVVDPHPWGLPPGLTVWREDLETVKRRPAKELDFDAAVVALPNRLHEAAVEWALERGWNVLCEKPLALQSAACANLAAAAEKTGRRLAVNMIRRLFPSYRLSRAMIASGSIGELTRVAMSHGGAYAWPARSLAPFEPANGGVLADMGVHYLDLAAWFLGKLTPLEYRDDWRGGVEADLQFSLRSESGVPLRIELSRLRSLRDAVRFEGTDGAIEIHVNDLEGLTWERNGISARVTARMESKPTFIDCFAEQLKALLADDGSEDASARHSIETMALIEWAYATREARAQVQPNPEPVCVTGGTGFIGGKLVQRLAELGFSDILVPVRRPNNCAGVARFPVRLITLDLMDEDAVRNALRGRGWVFHLAYGRDGTGQDTVTVDGTKNIVNAAIDTGCKGVVVLSTMAVIGKPNGEVDESAPYRPAYGKYGASKAAMEKWCLERAKTSRTTRIVVLNPSCVYGPDGPTYTELPAVLAGKGGFCWIDDGKGNANYLYVENLVDAILAATTVPDAHGQRFLINDGTTSWKRFLGPIVESWREQIPSYSLRELRDLAKQAARSRGSVVSAVRTALRDEEVRAELRDLTITRWLKKFVPPEVIGPSGQTFQHSTTKNGSPAVPPVWLSELFGPCGTTILSRKAEKVLGWRPRVSLEQGQRNCRAYLDWKGIS